MTDDSLRARVREIVERVIAEQSISVAEQSISVAEQSISVAEQSIGAAEQGIGAAEKNIAVAEQGARVDADCPRHYTVAIGADHGGFELKGILTRALVQREYRVLDCGTFSPDPADYPDIAYSVAKLVSDGAAWRGIIIDGAGIGSGMVANKVPGVRAANCNDVKMANNAREHNDANVLTLGAKMTDTNSALEIVRVFLTTNCTEPRHQKRVQKIMDIEKRYLRK